MSFFSFCIVKEFKNTFRQASQIRNSDGDCFVYFYVETNEEHPMLLCLNSEWQSFINLRPAAQNLLLKLQPSLLCYRHLFGRPIGTDPGWLSSAQRRADHPVMSSVCISVGRRIQERFRFSNAARVLLPLCDSPYKV